MPADVVEVTPALLRERPLPDPTDAKDKNDRGVVLVAGGSAETTGAVVLAGIAALRVGAGKLQLATVCSGRAPLAAAVAEARVVGLAETPSGAIDPGAADELVDLAARVDAVVLGSGTLDPVATCALCRRFLDRAPDGPTIILDANALPNLAPPVPDGTVLIPNPGEMAGLLGLDEGDDDFDPVEAVADVSRRFGATVALRGPETFITAPGEAVFHHRRGHQGLATSGSGDTLAGALGGLVATGADPLTATLWAVEAHARSGHRLAERIAPVGYLAREVLDELPSALDEARKAR